MRNRFLAFALLGAVLLASMWATYYLTRSSLLPYPIRLFQGERELFVACASYVRLSVRGDGSLGKHGALSERLTSCGVKRIYSDRDFIRFTFQNMPTDAVEEVGCALELGADPSPILLKYPDRTVFHFQQLGDGWYYCQWDIRKLK